MPESPPDPARRADVPGLLLGVAALAALTAVFIEAGQEGWLAPLPAALGVALLGSLLTTAGPGGHGLALQVPLTVAAGSLLAAVGLAWVATRPG